MAAHKQFNWIAILYEDEIQIIKVPQVRVMTRIEVGGEKFLERIQENGMASGIAKVDC